MIPLIVSRKGELTYTTALESVFSKWQFTVPTMEERFTSMGLLFTLERGGFGLLKEEIENDCPRTGHDPLNYGTAQGLLVTPKGRTVIASWGTHADDLKSVVYCSAATTEGGFALTASDTTDEVLCIILNERPEWSSREVAEFATSIGGVGAKKYLPYETKSLKELAEIWHTINDARKKD